MRTIEDHVAWTEGSSPTALSTICDEERKIVSFFFRDQVTTWTSYWNEPIPRDICRIFWRRARYDAHATMRHRKSLGLT